MTMRLFVLGATGRTGAQILDLALDRGHEVTAFVRSPRKITRRNEALRVVAGNPLRADEMAPALAGHDAVLSALGPPGRDALRPSTLMADLATSTVEAMKTASVHRLALVSAAVLFPEKGLFFAFFRWLLRHHARDLAVMEAVVRATPFDWTIARPPRLVASSDMSYRCERDGLPVGANSMSFRAVAAFLVDSVERRTHAREIVGLARGGGAA
jgi:putative NADH-flavin reductase